MAASAFSPPESRLRLLGSLPGRLDLERDALGAGSDPSAVGLALTVALLQVVGVARAHVDELEHAPASGEQHLDHVLEVHPGRFEDLGERHLDVTVEVGDHRAQLGQRSLEVAALLAQEVGPFRLLPVLLLGQRIDRADALAAPLQQLHCHRELGPFSAGEVFGLQGARAQVPAPEFGQCPFALLGLVAQVRERHLHAG